MAAGKIVIRGAKAHNLKNIDVEIPRDRLIVITGLSGSGKSSLAFDTIYAEGQRRYVESLSAYARQFLEQMEKPDVELIEGLSPAISIDQRTVIKNPRSTVGTVTEIYDYLRLLFSHIGKPFCYQCGKEISSQTIQQIADQILALPQGERVALLAPVVRGKKGEYRRELENLRRDGFVRVKIDGEMRDLSEEIHLDRNKKHDIDVVIDRMIIKDGIKSRIPRLLPGCFPLIVRMEHVQHVMDWGRRCISTQTCSSPTRKCRSWRGRSCRGKRRFPHLCITRPKLRGSIYVFLLEIYRKRSRGVFSMERTV